MAPTESGTPMTDVQMTGKSPRGQQPFDYLPCFVNVVEVCLCGASCLDSVIDSLRLRSSEKIGSSRTGSFSLHRR